MIGGSRTLLLCSEKKMEFIYHKPSRVACDIVERVVRSGGILAKKGFRRPIPRRKLTSGLRMNFLGVIKCRRMAQSSTTVFKLSKPWPLLSYIS